VCIAPGPLPQGTAGCRAAEDERAEERVLQSHQPRQRGAQVSAGVRVQLYVGDGEHTFDGGVVEERQGCIGAGRESARRRRGGGVDKPSDPHVTR